MKKATLILLVSLFAIASCDGPKRVKKLETDLTKASYAIGASIGGNFEKQGLEVDKDALITGLLDALEKKEMLLDEKARQEVLMNFGNQQREKMQAKAQKAAAEALEKGMVFLEENKKKAGFTATDSGLQYKVLTAAKAMNHPSAESTVRVHYTGKLIDGTVFDSSVERGTPAEFPVGGVIPGWTEALQMMSPGDKWEVVIPSVLVFEVELLAIL